MMDYDVYMHDHLGLDYLQYKPKVIQNGVLMNILLSFDIGEFTGCSFIEKVYLSTFGCILPCFTMMFLSMIL